MTKLIFEKVLYRNHKIVSRKPFFTLSDVSPRVAEIICQNFYDGFLSNFSSRYRVPVHPRSMGYVIDSWDLHIDGNGWQYRFVNGRNQLVRFS